MGRRQPGTKPYVSGILLLAALAAGIWLIFGGQGILRVYHLRAELDKINEDNRKLREDNDALQREIDSLRADMSYIERISRKELGMVKKGEMVFVFGKKDASRSPAPPAAGDAAPQPVSSR